MNVPARRPLTEGERLDRLRLARTESVGPITFFKLLQRYGTAARALEAVPDLASRGGRRTAPRIPSKSSCTAEFAALATLGGAALFSGEPGYPPLLETVEDRPPLLFSLGHPHLAARPVVAMVGARNASLAGRRFARDLAHDLAERGVTVISGLARGIDTAAHTGALEGGTAAVVAGGLDVVYPPENAELQHAIGAQGILLAEFPLGTKPQARHFPRRNRIVAGASAAVLVVEAAVKSGSLITARFALDYGRDVMAVPGAPVDPRSRGTNDLIRDGAHLVENADDVINVLNTADRPSIAEPTPTEIDPPPPLEPSERDLQTARSVVVECLGPTPVTVDELVRGCQVSTPVVVTILLELELAGRLERQPGNRVSLLFEPER